MPRAKKSETAEPKAPAQAKPKKESKAAKKAAASVQESAKDALIPPPSEEKLSIISQFQVKDGDTGSPEVQVALLTRRIEKLVSHLKMNPSDNHSRRGLLGIVSKRRRLLNYLSEKDEVRYKEVAKKLGLGK